MNTATGKWAWLTLTAILAIAAPCFGDGRTITVIFRADDYSAATNSQVESQLFGVFEKHNVPLTVAVVPRVVCNIYTQGKDEPPGEELPLPQEKIDRLRRYVERGVVEPALHGCCHELTSAPGQVKSEVAGLVASEQARLVAEGKQLLEQAVGRKVVTFIPPFNAYDKVTCDVLEQEGFLVLSAGLWEPAVPNSSLAFLPATSTLSDCRAAVAAARQSLGPSPVIVVLFHETDIIEAFEDGQMTLAQIGDLLDWINAQTDVRTMTIGGAAQAMPQLNAARFAAWVDLRDRPRTQHRRFLPLAIWAVNEALWAAPGKPWFYIPHALDIQRRWWTLHATVVGFWLVVLMAWFVVVRAVAQRSRRAAIIEAFALMFVVWLAWARGQYPSAQAAFLATALLGIVFGSLRKKTRIIAYLDATPKTAHLNREIAMMDRAFDTIANHQGTSCLLSESSEQKTATVPPSPASATSVKNSRRASAMSGANRASTPRLQRSAATSQKS